MNGANSQRARQIIGIDKRTYLKSIQLLFAVDELKTFWQLNTTGYPTGSTICWLLQNVPVILTSGHVRYKYPFGYPHVLLDVPVTIWELPTYPNTSDILFALFRHHRPGRSQWTIVRVSRLLLYTRIRHSRSLHKPPVYRSTDKFSYS